jgi:RNase P subunit RPR2|nr:hypothetical protein [Salinirussus salinus]
MSGADPGEPGRSLGSCPECETPIPGQRLLISYETTEGRSRMFAACPSCEAVVHPIGHPPQ